MPAATPEEVVARQADARRRWIATTPAPTAGDPAYLSFDQPESLADLDEYDRMGRLKHAKSTITGSTQDPRLEIEVDMTFHAVPILVRLDHNA